MSYSFEPIGVFKCQQKSPAEAPRQGSLNQREELGEVQLKPGQNFEQALTDLELFSHIWLVYVFHKNSSWKPMTQPPRANQKKVGTLASRSPYRPNPIGLTCVELVKIKGRTLWVKGFDLLDNTPILDIKPYLAYADSFPEASAGWIEESPNQYSVEFNEISSEQIKWLEQKGLSIEAAILTQLSSDPLDFDKKRVKAFDDQKYVLAFRTWRALFKIDNVQHKVFILGIASGYDPDELEDLSIDSYGDKALHQEFGQIFARETF